MFCKWCGANTAPSNTKCKRCGRELPALSDCGGFYDLVPGARRPAAEPAAAVGSPAQRIGQSKKRRGISAVAAAVIALLAVALVITLWMTNRYAGEVRRLEEELAAVTGQGEIVSGEDEEQLSTAVLAEAEVNFCLAFEEKNAELLPKGEMDLGGFRDETDISCDTEVSGTEVIYTAECRLENTGTTLKVKARCDNEKITVSYEADEAAFGAAEGRETYQWQYRIGEDSRWEDVPEDVFVLAPSVAETRLSILDFAALRDLVKDQDSELELRCQILRTNGEEGSLTVTVEGLRFFGEIDYTKAETAEVKPEEETTAGDGETEETTGGDGETEETTGGDGETEETTGEDTSDDEDSGDTQESNDY